MKGIISKDIFEMIYIRKNRNLLLFHYLIAFGWTVFSRSGLSFLVSAVVLVLMSACLLLQTTVDLDDKYNFHKIQFTFPVTKKEIVLSKYVSSLAFCVLNMLLLLLLMCVYVFVYRTLDLGFGLQIVLFSTLLSLILLAFYNYSCIVFGTKGGLWLYFSLVLSITAGYVLTKMNVNLQDVLERLVTLDPAVVSVFGLLASIVLLALSFLASVKGYVRKHS